MEESVDCRRCGSVVEDLPQQEYRCGCGVYPCVCEVCGSPHSDIGTVCNECFDDGPWEQAF